MSSPHPAAVVVLAAGEGTRMRSATPKVLHEIGGRSLLGHAVAAAATLCPEHLVVVVGHGGDRVAEHLGVIAPEARVAVQAERNGTGHAVKCALEAVPPLTGTVVVTYGDVPLLAGDTLETLVATHTAGRHGVTLLTATLPDPTGYGRLVRDPAGQVARIVEQKDADEPTRAIREVNSGIYAFDAALLARALDRVGTDNAQGEMYLTDVVALARAEGETVGVVPVADTWQVEGVNDRVQLAAVGRELNRRVVEAWMRAGITVIDPATTWIDLDVVLEPDVVVHPNCQLHGQTRVSRDAVIGPDTTLTDVVVGPAASVVRSVATAAEIGAGASVGPFSFLRPGTRLGPQGKIGAYCETKNVEIGTGSKVPHLSYVGDATIGEHSNIGAATIFVNYDGVAKHRSVVGDHARVGSDSMLVAPVRVGDGAYTAAGSVITEDVPPGALAVARGRQRNIEGWVQRKRAGSDSARAAAAAPEVGTEAGTTSSGGSSGDPGGGRRDDKQGSGQ